MSTPTSRTPTRVFLHVGSPKTGTTFLQHVLWTQKDQAAEQGLLLPLERFFDHFLASLDVRGLAGRREHPARAEGIWEQVVEEAHTWPGTVLVSHELFASATADQASAAIAAFGPDAEVHVVLTARDLVRQIPAEWQEHVKHRSPKRFGDFVAELRGDDGHTTWFWRVQDFADVLDRWGSTLPPERVHVVTVPPAGTDPGTLWDRFATLLGLDPNSFETTVPHANTSLGLEQAELLRRVNLELGERLPLPGPYARVVKNLFAQKLLAARPGTPLALDAEDTDFAVRRSREIADRIRDSGVDVVGNLDELVPATPGGADAAAPVTYPEPTAETLLAESIEALAGVLDALAERNANEQRYRQLVADLKRSPVRFTLVRASERRPVLRKARRLYQRARGRTSD